MALKVFRVCFAVKEECASEDEEEVKDTLVEQILQQGDTAVIYPEAPEDDQSPAETGGADENGNIQSRSSTPFFGRKNTGGRRGAKSEHSPITRLAPFPHHRHARLLLPVAHLPVLLAGLQAQRLAEGAHQVPARDQRGQLQLLALQLHLHLPLAAGEAHEPSQRLQGAGKSPDDE